MVHCAIKYKGGKTRGWGKIGTPHELIGLQQLRTALWNAMVACAHLSAQRLSGGTNGLWSEEYATDQKNITRLHCLHALTTS